MKKFMTLLVITLGVTPPASWGQQQQYKLITTPQQTRSAANAGKVIILEVAAAPSAVTYNTQTDKTPLGIGQLAISGNQAAQVGFVKPDAVPMQYRQQQISLNNLLRYPLREVGVGQIIQESASLTPVSSIPAGFFLSFCPGDSLNKKQGVLITADGKNLKGVYRVFRPATLSDYVGGKLQAPAGMYINKFRAEFQLLGIADIRQQALPALEKPKAPADGYQPTAGAMSNKQSHIAVKTTGSPRNHKPQPAAWNNLLRYPVGAIENMALLQESVWTDGIPSSVPEGFFPVFCPHESVAGKYLSLNNGDWGIIRVVRPLTVADYSPQGQVIVPEGMLLKPDGLETGWSLLAMPNLGANAQLSSLAKWQLDHQN
jgi:hypothetical protein